LTYFVLGLTITSPKGATWSLAPHLSGLEVAEGGFETVLGWFGVKWFTQNGHLLITLNVPTGTQGVVNLPGTGGILVDGEEVLTTADGSFDIDGGKHNITRRLQ
jgi:hypothetical protein